MISSALASWRWNESGTAGPGIFSPFHIVSFVLMVIFTVIFGVIASRKHDKKQDDKIILILDIILFVLEFFKQIMYHVGYYHYLRIDVIPFSFCSVPLYIALVGALVKNEKIKDVCYRFLSFFGIVGGICVMIYPASLETSFVFSSIQTMVWHSVLVIMGVYLIIARGYGKKLKELAAPAILFLCLSIVAVILNESIYYGFLKKAQTPEYEAQYMPGSYEYYCLGYKTDDTYHLLSENNGELELTEDYSKSLKLVITYANGDGSKLHLGFTDRNGNEKYLEILDDGGSKRFNITDNPQSSWTFDYSGPHPVFAVHFDDGDCCFNFGDKVGIAKISQDGTVNDGNFIKATSERESDSATFFFISNHYKTIIPGLDVIQEKTPYLVFLLVYFISFCAVSALVFAVAFTIRTVILRHSSGHKSDDGGNIQKPKSICI